MANQIKTYNGIAIADIKTINGIAVANIKAFNGISFESSTTETVTVENKTTDYNITTNDSGNVLTNEGAGGEVNLTLPNASAGLYYIFVCKSSNKLDILLQAGDKFIKPNDGTEYTTGAYAETNGRSISMVAVDDTYWMIYDQNGFTLYT